ncbi:3099_t:CDS:2 [Ambispora gerdemannii]|uniref:3099_t:CDS:1 n=1 Tax=Ambispora gerdemannii TaxID=144530 RepID=A0A9N9B670_9GLOM|nr:3099_t:CDS:2 [Ambispora gerdemannii]
MAKQVSNTEKTDIFAQSVSRGITTTGITTISTTVISTITSFVLPPIPYYKTLNSSPASTAPTESAKQNDKKSSHSTNIGISLTLSIIFFSLILFMSYQIWKRKKNTAAFATQKCCPRRSIVSQTTTESSTLHARSLLEIEVMTQTLKIPRKGKVIDGIRVKRIGTTQKKHNSALLKSCLGFPEEKTRKPGVSNDQVNLPIASPPPIYRGESICENKSWYGGDCTERKYELNEVNVHEQPEYSNPFLDAGVEELEDDDLSAFISDFVDDCDSDDVNRIRSFGQFKDMI